MDHTGFAPAHHGRCFHGLHCSGSKLLYRRTVQRRPCVLCTSQVWAAQVQVLGYYSRVKTWLGMCFVPFTHLSTSGDQMLGECTVLGGPCILITSLLLASWFTRYSVRASSQMCCMSPLGIWSQVVTLLAVVHCLGPRKTWLGTGSLLTIFWRMPFFGWDGHSPSGYDCCNPASLPLDREGPISSQPALLYYWLSHFFLWVSLGWAVP